MPLSKPDPLPQSLHAIMMCFPRATHEWSSTSSNTQPTTSPGATVPPSTAGSSRTAHLLKRQGSQNVHLVVFLCHMWSLLALRYRERECPTWQPVPLSRLHTPTCCPVAAETPRGTLHLRGISSFSSSSSAAPGCCTQVTYVHSQGPMFSCRTSFSNCAPFTSVLLASQPPSVHPATDALHSKTLAQTLDTPRCLSFFSTASMRSTRLLRSLRHGAAVALRIVSCASFDEH